MASELRLNWWPGLLQKVVVFYHEGRSDAILRLSEDEAGVDQHNGAQDADEHDAPHLHPGQRVEGLGQDDAQSNQTRHFSAKARPC